MDVSSQLILDQFAIISPKGKFTYQDITPVRSELSKFLDQKVDILIDLSGIDYIDSAGLGVIVGGLARCRNNGKEMYILNPSPQVFRVLKMTKLDSLLPIISSIEELKNFKKANKRKSTGA